MEQLFYAITTTLTAMIFGILSLSILSLIVKFLFKKKKTVEVFKIREFLDSNNLDKTQKKRFENLIYGKPSNYKVIPPKELEHLTY